MSVTWPSCEVRGVGETGEVALGMGVGENRGLMGVRGGDMGVRGGGNGVRFG